VQQGSGERGFATARFTDKSDDLTLRQFEIDAFDCTHSFHRFIRTEPIDPGVALGEVLRQSIEPE
jgi:hypothetical protein